VVSKCTKPCVHRRAPTCNTWPTNISSSELSKEKKKRGGGGGGGDCGPTLVRGLAERPGKRINFKPATQTGVGREILNAERKVRLTKSGPKRTLPVICDCPLRPDPGGRPIQPKPRCKPAPGPKFIPGSVPGGKTNKNVQKRKGTSGGDDYECLQTCRPRGGNPKKQVRTPRGGVAGYGTQKKTKAKCADSQKQQHQTPTRMFRRHGVKSCG